MLLDGKKQGIIFSDVNCRLCAKIGNQFRYFEDEEFMEFIGELDEDIRPLDDMEDKNKGEMDQ